MEVELSELTIIWKAEMVEHRQTFLHALTERRHGSFSLAVGSLSQWKAAFPHHGLFQAALLIQRRPVLSNHFSLSVLSFWQLPAALSFYLNNNFSNDSIKEKKKTVPFKAGLFISHSQTSVPVPYLWTGATASGIPRHRLRRCDLQLWPFRGHHQNVVC